MALVTIKETSRLTKAIAEKKYDAEQKNEIGVAVQSSL